MNPLRTLAGSPWLMPREDFRALCMARGEAAPLAGLVPSKRADDDAPSRRSDPGYRMAGGVAVVEVYGPIYRHSTPLDDFFARIFGGCCVDKLADSLRSAIADPNARALLLTFDSGGGEAAGVGELAGMIREASAVKPIASYVEAHCCSGAYWLASATGEITAAPSSFTGSVGAVCVLYDDSKFQDIIGIKEVPIVSTQSPLKYPDISTDAGLAVYQKRIDALAAVFISAVASYRGKSADDVLAKFGKGASLIASEAKSAGMIDRVGTLDDVISKLSGRNRARLAVSRPAASTQGAAGLRLRPRPSTP